MRSTHECRTIHVKMTLRGYCVVINNKSEFDVVPALLRVKRKMDKRYRLGAGLWLFGALVYVIWMIPCNMHRVPARTGPERPKRPSHTKRARHHATRSLLLLSDPHIAGPEIELDVESNPMDSLSVLKAASRLYHVLKERHTSRPTLVLVLGDIVHDGLRVLEDPNSLASFQRDLFDKSVNGYTIASGLFKEFLPSARILYTFGNHDGLTTCGRESQSILNRKLLSDVYRSYFDTEPFDVWDDTESNWSFVSLNGLWGETWDASSPWCNTELASFGGFQLAWLGDVLNDRKNQGRYVLITTHFPLTATVVQERGTSLSMKQLLESYSSTIKGVITGHFHKGILWNNGSQMHDAQGTGGVPVLTVPAVRYSSNNSFIVDLHSDGTWEVPGFTEKNKHGARCSWGDVRGQGHHDGHDAGRDQHDRSTNDAGDCGVPLAGHESEIVIMPVTSMEQYPNATVFNPEGSCRWELAAPFFGPCTPDVIDVGDNERTCCAVLQEAFWPGSSHPFSTCLCIDAFWEAVVARVFAEDGDEGLVDVLRRCDRRGMFLIWPRRRIDDGRADYDKAGKRTVETFC